MVANQLGRVIVDSALGYELKRLDVHRGLLGGSEPRAMRTVTSHCLDRAFHGTEFDC